MESSPKAALRNNKYMKFIKNLINIAKKNKITLLKEDFDFLLPFMKKKEKTDYLNFFNKFSIEKINIKNKTFDEMEIKNKDGDDDDDEVEDEDAFLKVKIDEKERKKKIKDDYLLSDENNKIGSIRTLLNKTKMKDYSFFDFFKFKSHLINFAILSFLWAVYNFIKYGIEATLNEIPDFYYHSFWDIIIQGLGLLNLFLIMILYLIKQNSSYKIVISIQLLTFIALLCCAYLDDNEINIVYYIIALLIGKIIWNCLYLLLIIMSLLIYPIMLRSKGLGWNIALGIVGKLLVIFVIDLTSKHDYILYFLLFVFLTLVFSNSLPSKIGSLTIDLSRDEKAKKILDKIIKESEDGELSADDGKISLMSIISS